MSAWQQVQDDQGRVYYYNSATQETSWENPEAQSQGTWKTYTTEDGKEYYYNETTGETTWDKPAEFQKSTETDSESISQNNIKEDENEHINESQGMSDLDKELASQPLLESKLVNIPRPKNEKEAKTEFQDMLKDGGVDATWSFEKVIKTFIKNKSYWAIDDAVERRTIYEDFLVSKLERESSNKTGLIEEFKKNFVREIQTYLSSGKITEKTRWISVKNLLTKEENPIFEHSILPDRELEKLYKECTEKVRSEVHEALQKEKDQALQELEGYLLQVIKGNEEISWDQLYTRLQTDARFKANKHFRVLDKLDILQLYSSKIYPTLIGKIRAEISSIEKVNYRSDRHARDAYKKLLSTKSINANTLFKAILPELENEDVFIELCGRNGSTPLELFWDIVEERKQLQKVKKDLIEHSLRAHLEHVQNGPDYEAALENFEKFLPILQSVTDERLANVDLMSEEGIAEVKVIYETLKNELHIQKKHEKAAFERKLGGQVHALAEWIAFHQESVDSTVLVFEKQKSTETDAKNLDDSAVPVVRITERDATAIISHFDISVWKEKLQKVEAFSRVLGAVTSHYKIPEKADSALEDMLAQCVREVAAIITSTLTRKRAAPENTTQDVKRSRPEGEKKPVLMNY